VALTTSTVSSRCSALAVTIFVVFAYRYDMDSSAAPVLALAAIALGYATTWNEGTCRRSRRYSRTDQDPVRS